ncbi:8481_t:CDS:2, partial [Scutellospora calospora]
SNFHKYGVIDFENLDGKKSHAFTELYNNSKLMINLYSNELNRRLKESTTNIVNQDQLSNFGKILRNMELLCFAKSPEVGC